MSKAAVASPEAAQADCTALVLLRYPNFQPDWIRKGFLLLLASRMHNATSSAVQLRGVTLEGVAPLRNGRCYGQLVLVAGDAPIKEHSGDENSRLPTRNEKP